MIQSPTVFSVDRRPTNLLWWLLFFIGPAITLVASSSELPETESGGHLLLMSALAVLQMAVWRNKPPCSVQVMLFQGYQGAHLVASSAAHGIGFRSARLAGSSLLIAVMMFAGMSNQGHASPLLNSGFESHSRTWDSSNPASAWCYMNGSTCTADGWNGNAALIQSSSVAWGHPSGLAGWHGSAQGDTILGLQTITQVSQSFSTSQTGTYLLSWLDAGRTAYAAARYQVKLDGQVLDTFNTVAGDDWTEHRLNLKISSGAHTLRFQGLYVSGDGTAFLDNINLELRPDTQVSSVPEPDSIWLSLAGLVMLSLRRRRR